MIPASAQTIKSTVDGLVLGTRVDLGEIGSGALPLVGDSPVDFKVSVKTDIGGDWLSVKQTSGTMVEQIPGRSIFVLDVQGTRHGLAIGQYSGSITVTPNGGTPLVVPTFLLVCQVPKTPLDPCFPGQQIPPLQGPGTNPGTTVSALPSSLSFTVVRGTSAGKLVVNVQDSGTPQDVTVQTTTQDGAKWLTVNQASLRTPGQLEVTAAGQSMTAGTYTGEVDLSTASGSPTKVPVTMRVLDPAPTVTAMDPSFIAAPSPDTTFTITGDGFKPGAQLQLTVSTAQMANVDVPVPNAPTVLDAKTLRAVIPGTFLLQPGFIMVRVLNPNAVPSDALKLTVGRPMPEIRQNGISNSASLTGNSVAPGQLITIFGAAMGPTQPATGSIDAHGALSRTAGGVRVLFDGQPGGVLFASDTQINAVVPNSISKQADTLITVEYNGNTSQGVRVPVVPAAPGVFTTDGGSQALMTRAVTPVADASSAADRDEVVTLYATGAGLLHDSAGDAMIATDVEKPMLPVTVRIGGQDAEVLYAGTSPGQLEAVMQLNVRIPAAVAPGTVPVELMVGGVKSQAGVNIVVK